MSDFYQNYLKVGRIELLKELGLKNIMSVPKLKKVVLNVSLGEALVNKKAVDIVSKELGAISGQRPVATRAKKDISSFKVRKGDVVGVKVTLRAQKMYDFVEKLIKIVLPRIRDFRGIPGTSFDKSGNYTLGISEQIVFPEIDYSSIDKIRGMEITLVTNTNKDHTQKLMEYLGFPFEGRKKGSKIK